MPSTENVQRQALFDCSGLVAVITGGGTGLGLIMARALATNGATVYIIGRRLAKLEEAAASTTNIPQGARIIPLECDASSKESLSKAAAHVAEETGYINLLIANAGIIGQNYDELAPRAEDDARGKLTIQEAQKQLWDTDPDKFVEVYKINVAGVLFTATAFLDLLDKGNEKKNVRQMSQVLVTSSIGGFHRSFQQPGLAYTTSKAATTHMVKTLATFLIQWRIRVNAIAPGLFPSEMLVDRMGDKDFTVEGTIPKSFQPMGRAGKEEEMAGTVLYLASEAGAYCTGSIQVVDGIRKAAVLSPT